MKTKILTLTLLSFLSIGLWQCSEDEVFSGTGSDVTAVDPYETVQNSRIATVISNQTLTTTLVGVVTNTSNTPQVGVLVKAGDKIAITEADGSYILSDVKSNKDFVKVTAEKDGYFLAIKTFTPSASSSLNTVNLQLAPKGSAVSFTSSSGGKVVFGNKIEIEFDANQIVKEEDGTPYSGNVNVYSHYYNPTATNFPETMPGNLNGFDLANNFVALDSYGMMTVQMTDAAGNPLNIAKGQKVKIKIPVPTGAGITPPTTIPLWRLNETYGIWVEVGTANKVGAFYEGEVDHFSSYNLDLKFNDPFRLNIQLRDEKNKPLKGQKAYVQVGDRISKLEVITDENGKVELFNADKNLEYKVTVVLECETVTATFGPYTDLNAETVNEKFKVIDTNVALSYNLTGEVLACETYTPAPGDVVLIKLEAEGKPFSFTGKLDANGKFDTTQLICNINLTGTYPVTVSVYDLGDIQKNTHKPLT